MSMPGKLWPVTMSSASIGAAARDFGHGNHSHPSSAADMQTKRRCLPSDIAQPPSERPGDLSLQDPQRSVAERVVVIWKARLGVLQLEHQPVGGPHVEPEREGPRAQTNRSQRI